MRILLVEDNETNIKSLTQQLSAGGHQVTVARDCKEFKESIRECHSVIEKAYDFVITDIMIPRGDVAWLGGDGRPPTDQFYGGLVVALLAFQRGVPCAVISNINGHHDFLGYMLETCFYSRDLPKAKTPLYLIRYPRSEKDGGKLIEGPALAHLGLE